MCIFSRIGAKVGRTLVAHKSFLSGYNLFLYEDHNIMHTLYVGYYAYTIHVLLLIASVIRTF